MSALRPPTVVGASGGVGTTTLAVALRGRDGGTGLDGTGANGFGTNGTGPNVFGPNDTGPDIVACRATADSLERAARVLNRAGAGPLPVLAVTLDGARLPRGPLRARLLLLEPATSAVILLPRVPHWRALADPLPEVATLLVDPPPRLTRPLRAYTAALRELAAAVVASGRLELPPPRGDARGRAGDVAGPPPGRPAPAAGVRRADQPSRFPVADAHGATRQPGPLGGAERRRPAPPVLASLRPVAAPPGTSRQQQAAERPAPQRPPVQGPPVQGQPGQRPPVQRPAGPSPAAHPAATHRGETADPSTPPQRQRGIRIVTAPPVERAG